jgi:hypothetical protein
VQRLLDADAHGWRVDESACESEEAAFDVFVLEATTQTRTQVKERDGRLVCE